MTSLDYKVSSLRRQLDKLRSRNKAHTTYLNILIAEADKMAGTDSKQVNITCRDGFHIVISVLEQNCLHS